MGGKRTSWWRRPNVQAPSLGPHPASTCEARAAQAGTCHFWVLPLEPGSPGAWAPGLLGCPFAASGLGSSSSTGSSAARTGGRANGGAWAPLAGVVRASQRPGLPGTLENQPLTSQRAGSARAAPTPTRGRPCPRSWRGGAPSPVGAAGSARGGVRCGLRWSPRSPPRGARPGLSSSCPPSPRRPQPRRLEVCPQLGPPPPAATGEGVPPPAGPLPSASWHPPQFPLCPPGGAPLPLLRAARAPLRPDTDAPSGRQRVG